MGFLLYISYHGAFIYSYGNVCLVKTKQGIRKMTPKECFNTQGFPESFVLPEFADGRLYKQAGNSVCVSVVQRIAEQMLVAMK